MPTVYLCIFIKNEITLPISANETRYLPQTDKKLIIKLLLEVITLDHVYTRIQEKTKACTIQQLTMTRTNR